MNRAYQNHTFCTLHRASNYIVYWSRVCHKRHVPGFFVYVMFVSPPLPAHDSSLTCPLFASIEFINTMHVVYLCTLCAFYLKKMDGGRGWQSSWLPVDFTLHVTDHMATWQKRDQWWIYIASPGKLHCESVVLIGPNMSLHDIQYPNTAVRIFLGICQCILFVTL